MYLVPIFPFEYIFPSITLQFWNLQVQQGARSSWIKNKLFTAAFNSKKAMLERSAHRLVCYEFNFAEFVHNGKFINAFKLCQVFYLVEE